MDGDLLSVNHFRLLSAGPQSNRLLVRSGPSVWDSLGPRPRVSFGVERATSGPASYHMNSIYTPVPNSIPALSSDNFGDWVCI